MFPNIVPSQAPQDYLIQNTVQALMCMSASLRLEILQAIVEKIYGTTTAEFENQQREANQTEYILKEMRKMMPPPNSGASVENQGLAINGVV